MGLGAARDDRVGAALAQEAQALADRLRARGAGRHDGDHGPAGLQGAGEPRRRVVAAAAVEVLDVVACVGGEAGEVGAAVVVLGAGHPLDVFDARAAAVASDDGGDPAAAGDLVEPRRRGRLARGGEQQAEGPVGRRVLPAAGGREPRVVDLAADPAGEARGVEARDLADAGEAELGLRPGRLDAPAERRHHAPARDDDPLLGRPCDGVRRRQTASSRARLPRASAS